MKKLACAALAWIGMACGSGTSSPAVDDFVVDIQNGGAWPVRGQAGRNFDLNPALQGERHEGTFTGTETSIACAPIGCTLEGSYTGRQIQFTVHRGADVAYQGQFLDKITMEVTGGGETLTLDHGPGGALALQSQ